MHYSDAIIEYHLVHSIETVDDGILTWIIVTTHYQRLPWGKYMLAPQPRMPRHRARAPHHHLSRSKSPPCTRLKQRQNNDTIRK